MKQTEKKQKLCHEYTFFTYACSASSMLQEKRKHSALLKMALVEQPDTAETLELLLAKVCTS